jgi:GWxTD domain-containing protein
VLCPARLFALVALGVTLLAGRAPATEDPLQSTLFAVKAAYKAKRYDAAEQSLRRLLELAAAPEREAVRSRVLPAYHFYAAAVAYERHDEERARTELSRFFEFQPEATLDPEMYPKGFRLFFEARRNEKAKEVAAAAPPSGKKAIEGGVMPGYATHDFDEAAIPQNTGHPEWIDSPVRALLTDADRKRWQTLPDDESRRDFVIEFWKRLDPDPVTPVNEFEVEFYRRVQYADATLSTEEVRGSLSDRGQVLLILGPPSYVGRRTLKPSEDIMNYLQSTQITIVSSKTGGGSLERVPRRVPVSQGDVKAEIETWHYRRDRIPKGVAFTELDFQFVTQQGYGNAVLQKEARELNALKMAARLLRRESAE